MDNKVRSKKFALYTVLEVIGVFIILLVGNCFDWVNLTFSFEKICQASYWNNVVVQTIMYVCAMFIGIFGNLENNELKNEDYFRCLSIYREWLEKKTDSFVHFIENVFNPNTKQKFIKKKYDNKLYRLNIRAKDEWQNDFAKAIKSEGKNYNFSSKKSKKYYTKRILLEEMASKAYISENYEHINCKYPKVNAHSFTYFLDVKVSDTSMYKVENQTAKDMSLSAAKKVLFGLASASVIGLIIWDPSANELLQQANGWISLMVKYIIRCTMVIVNLIMGAFNGKILFNENFLLPIENRTRILKEYCTWKDNSPEESEFKKKLNEAIKKNKEEYDTKLQTAKDEMKSKVEEIKKIQNTKDTNII